ncbi:MAG TPA: twin-arginine translocase TatA/TatE family subunit [Nitrosopumilaceae archaeon]|nr:twin-arginine translocase TatA/TatE family subunit [Nitrosopumilaceae archaeon]
MFDYTLNVAGSEWIIIIFVVLVLILGTNKLPEAAKKLGKAVNEYNKAKNGIQEQMKDYTSENLKVSGPVENEHQKLEMIAKNVGIDPKNKTDEELRNLISSKLGKSEGTTSKN